MNERQVAVIRRKRSSENMSVTDKVRKEREMNIIKKSLAAAFAFAMILGSAGGIRAEDKELDGVPSDQDTGTVTITNLNEGDQVTFYQIVKANYSEDKGDHKENFVGYEAVKDKTIKLYDDDGALYPTAEEIGKLAKDTSGLTTVVGPVTVAEGETSVEQDLAAGEWMAIVTPAAESGRVYNPMVVSVYYTENGTKITSGSVDAQSNYEIHGDTGVAKSTDIPLKKEITDNTKGDVATADAGKNGDDLAVGDIIDFTVESVIPAYNKDKFTNPTYIIRDELDKGLDLEPASGADVEVFVGGTDDENKLTKDTDYEITATARGFEITLKPDYILSIATKTQGEGEDAKVVPTTDEERKIYVEYSAILTDEAKTNIDANENKVSVEYSQNSDEETTSQEKKTYQYTFEIDGMLSTDEDEKEALVHRTHELIKTNENGLEEDTVKVIDDGKTVISSKEIKELSAAELVEKFGITEEQAAALKEDLTKNPLAGAVFELTSTDRDPAKVYYAESDADGLFGASDNKYDGKDITGFKGLDAGTYTLKEVKAPDGYAVDHTEHTVEISATYMETGELESYTIKIDGENTTTYKVKKTSSGEGEEETVTYEVEQPAKTSTIIKNTKTPELPSTGGAGTYALTIVGVAVFVAAAYMAFKERKA